MKVLVLNCGSSSIKYKLISMTTEKVLVSGQIERIGTNQALLKQENSDGKVHKDVADIPNHDKGIEVIIASLLDENYGAIKKIDEIDCVGHRVVHGGDKFSGSVVITDEVKEKIKDCIDLAPLHNPNNLKGILSLEKILPNVPQTATFDTAFHQSIPEHGYLYGLPYSFYQNEKIRRYGFHGTSHRFVSEKAAKMLGKRLNDLKIITAHLGNGGSITAVKHGKSVDTSMGFTPLEGIMMGTRSGDVDPAIIFYMMNKMEMNISEIDNVMNKYSGLLGVSGVSNDMREIESAALEGNNRAELAKEMFCYRIKKYIGSYLAVLDGADAIVFTGGIGENNASTREKICDRMEYVGLRFDKAKNKETVLGKEGFINLEESNVKVLVVSTDEELVIARDAKNLIGK